MSERACAYCQLPISGRSDKKFCDDQCRSAYGAKYRKTVSDPVRRINAVLKRNREILLALNPSGKTVTSKSELVWRGFDFAYHTSIYQTRSGSTYHYCYDIGYLVLGAERVLVVYREPGIKADQGAGTEYSG